MTSKSVLTT